MIYIWLLVDAFGCLQKVKGKQTAKVVYFESISFIKFCIFRDIDWYLIKTHWTNQRPYDWNCKRQRQLI